MSKNGKTKDGFKNRQYQESGEGMPIVKTNAPADRFQTEGQVATVQDALDVKTAKPTGLAIEKESIPSQVTHTKKVAELKSDIKGLSGSGGMSGALGLKRGSYSGKANIVGDMSGTTQLSKSDRSLTRSGKKLDSTLKHINYLYNEQVEVEYDESKPLAENPEDTQGFNGTYRNEHARTQKRSGFVPAELYYDRSVDEIHTDCIYPVMGQDINDPAATSIPSYDQATGEYVDTTFSRGNHAHTAMNVTFNKNGEITNFAFGDLDMTPDPQDYDVANISALNGVIDANIAELDRQVMDDNAGDELSPKWSPLPRSTIRPTDILALIRDMEASTGAEVFMSYKKTALASSYQLSKAAKDGQRLDAPINEMLLGTMKDTITDTTVVGSVDYHNPFNSTEYAAGSAALMIAIFDSINKYNTKGDFLLQPRGFRMHLQTADNNMNSLWVPKKFVDVVNNNEVFSTIDKDYDPFLPVCITDKCSLAHPYSFNQFIENNAPKSFNYMYKNNSNNAYVVRVFHPLVQGLYEFLKMYGSKIASLLGGKDENAISIPCMHSTVGFSLWSLMILAATPFIVKSRLTSMVDIFDYMDNFGYPFRQLVSMKDANPMAARNYTNNDYNEPITVGKMSTATAMRWIFPETYWIQSENGSKPQIVLPWYHNELQYDMVNGKLVLSDTPGVMSMPSVRSGTRLGSLDTAYSMTERDLRLCLDRQTVYPAYKKNANTSMKAYKYGLTGDGQVVINVNETDWTYEALMKTPREIGWVIPAPNGMLTQLLLEFTSSSKYKTGRIKYTDSMSSLAPGFFRIRYWQGTAADTTSILSPDSINVNRAMSLQQVFKTIINQRMVGAYRDYTGNDFIVSLAACFDATAANPAVVNNRALFKPFTVDGAKSTATDDKVVTLQKYYWTRVQRLPFAINPFDCSPQVKDSGSDDAVKTDPYDFLYIFGCAGFRGSDYNEDSYNRQKARLNFGMLFEEDPYFIDSLAYRGE